MLLTQETTKTELMGTRHKHTGPGLTHKEHNAKLRNEPANRKYKDQLINPKYPTPMQINYQEQVGVAELAEHQK